MYTSIHSACDPVRACITVGRQQFSSLCNGADTGVRNNILTKTMADVVKDEGVRVVHSLANATVEKYVVIAISICQVLWRSS